MRTRCIHKLLVTVFASTVVGGCGLFRNDNLVKVKGPRLSKTIARLPELDLAPAVEVAASEIEVLDAYRAVYGRVADVQQNHQLGLRLADLELSHAGELDAEGATKDPYTDAVELY